MSSQEATNFLYLVWKDPVTSIKYTVGQLSKNSQYEFRYGFEVNKAMEKGFKLLISFEEISMAYKSDILFPTFSSRLPDSRRSGIDQILSKYGLDQFDEYELLKKSGARLPMDTLEFIEPLLKQEK